MTLNNLKTGQTGIVKSLNNEAAERRRLFDLGILPGTKIENVMPSPLGDPIAYRVRNSVIALRREQARLVEIEETESGS